MLRCDGDFLCFWDVVGIRFLGGQFVLLSLFLRGSVFVFI